MHATWNLLNGLLGDERLTGGAFGIAFFWLTIALGTLPGAYLVWLAYRQHKFIRPFWAATPALEAPGLPFETTGK
ncbi:hypothetical protein [Hymenobacter terrenus]|uniref:hypothetical protein n=1 Tax=Hymenobacter terrenus TaxID=1629124 RepID=UPI0006192D97|nr:hypothetical protein [Hymenobacter terrenus]